MQEIFNVNTTSLVSIQPSAFSIILFILTFLSILFNFLILVALLRKFGSISSSNKFVLNLILSNFLTSTFILPFFVAASFQGEWDFGFIWCKISSILYYLVVITSFQTMGHIAIDRYYAIMRPLTYCKVISRCKCLSMILGTWLQAVLLLVLPALLTTESLFSFHPGLGFCTVRWEVSLPYSGVVFSLSVALPLALMSVAYFRIYRVVKSQAGKLNLLRVSTAPPNPTGRKPSWMADFGNGQVCPRGVVILNLIVASYVLTAGPMVVLGLARDSSAWAHRLSLLALVSGQVCHPVTYGLLNRSIRRDLIGWLFPRWRRSSMANALLEDGSVLNY